MKRPALVSTLLVIFVAFITSSGPAQVSNPEVAKSVDRRIQDLERRVSDLEARLGAPEGGTPNGATSKGSGSIPEKNATVASRPASLASETNFEPGMVAKTYLRETLDQAAAAPASNDRTSDELRVSSENFNATVVAEQAGYKNHPVTVVWEGYLKIMEEDIYEFFMDEASLPSKRIPYPYQASSIAICSATIGSISGAKPSVALQLKPGYWPVLVRTAHGGPKYPSSIPRFSMKRKGHPAIEMSPGAFWIKSK